jgi:hypothetical protein
VVRAEEIIITDADSVWGLDLISASEDVIDSTDALVQDLLDWVFASHADNIWNIELISAPPDAIDSTDVPTEFLIKGAFVSHGDSVLNIGLEKTNFETSSQKWSFAIITDLHIGRGYPDYDGSSYESNSEKGWTDSQEEGEDYYLTERLKKVVNWINENKNKVNCDDTKCPIRFLAVLGDIADTAEKSEFLKAKNILNKLNDPNGDGNTSDGIPYVPVFGNHDVWPYTDFEEANYSQGEEFFDEIFWDENATNTQLIKERFNNSFKRDEVHKNYKNFAFSYQGMNFIGLDFVSRNPVPFDKGVGSDAVRWEETTNWLKDCLIEHKECLKGYEKNPNIIFSHHPLVENLASGFSPKEINEIRTIMENELVIADFGGHIHGFYPRPVIGGDYFWDANREYSSVGNTSVITTEALMVGSNEDDEYLKEHDKGIIKIIKVLGENEIDYKTNEGKYKPETGEGKEFIALNPYMAFDYESLSGEPCMLFKGHAFTKREYSFLWKVNDAEIGSGEKVEYCFPEAPKDYQVELKVVDKENPNVIEKIIQKIKVKLGIIPKLLKVTGEMKEKLELISTTLGENLIEIGRTVRDTALIKVKHSEPTPVGLINIHFEQASEDIDLTNMVVDSNIETRKSILFMPEWPNVIEQEKILFIPK